MFRTCKYRPDYPVHRFESMESAREWMSGFVQWYNEVHRHSSIRHVTPGRHHRGEGAVILAQRDEVFDSPAALAMLIDVFSERGYNAMIDKQINAIPEKVDLETGQIHYQEKSVYRIQIGFKGSSIRRG